MRPRHLLAGKVIGIGLLGLAQLALIAGLAAALLAAGVFDAPAALGGSVALVVPWFALGFALYAVAYATAGALASRQQNADTAGQPVTYTLVAAYFVGYMALSGDPNGLLANLLTVFPLSAPLVLPARSALVGVPLWEHSSQSSLVLATIYALVLLAGRIYGRGLLHGGPAPRSANRLAPQPRALTGSPRWIARPSRRALGGELRLDGAVDVAVDAAPPRRSRTPSFSSTAATAGLTRARRNSTSMLSA